MTIHTLTHSHFYAISLSFSASSNNLIYVCMYVCMYVHCIGKIPINILPNKWCTCKLFFTRNFDVICVIHFQIILATVTLFIHDVFSLCELTSTVKGHLSWSFYFLYVIGIVTSHIINYILVSISSELWNKTDT